MKALIYKGPEKIKLEDIPKPEAKKDELLIKIKRVGICGSDFQGYLGNTGRRNPPMIMGHELSGMVQLKGNSIKFKKGDKVVIQPKLYCGKCVYCKSGLTNMCPNSGFLGALNKNGGMAEYLAISEKNVFKVNEEISYTEACMVEPLSVAYRAVSMIKNKDLQNAEFLLLVGAGTIGLLLLQVLKMKNAKNVIVSDLSNFRLENAKKLGADFTINPQRVDFLAKVKEITKGKFINYSFEAVGHSNSTSQSLEALKKCGTAVWVGNAQKIIEVNMQRIVTTEINIKGSYLYSENDFLDSLRLIEKKEINSKPIISLEEKLENSERVFEQLKNNKDGKIIKVVLTN